MRVLSALILSTALALPLASAARAEEPVRSISVTGTGTVEAAPDMATLMIGVTTQAATAAEALAESGCTAFIGESFLFARVVRMRFRGDVDRHIRKSFAIEFNHAIGADS